jgi:hypothetical protein
MDERTDPSLGEMTRHGREAANWAARGTRAIQRLHYGRQVHWIEKIGPDGAPMIQRVSPFRPAFVAKPGSLPGQQATFHRLGTVSKGLGRVGTVLSAVTNGAAQFSHDTEDQDTEPAELITRCVYRGGTVAGAGWAAGLAGAELGAALGAVVGTALAPGPGTAVGTVYCSRTRAASVTCGLARRQ